MSGDRILVSYEAMQGAQAEMGKIAGQIQQEIEDLKGQLAKIEWEGQDANAYNEHQAAASQSVIDIKELLEQIAAAVGQAHDNYNETERSNAASW
ncbi:hypothetical protein Afil01_66260 [Actinorhabdospora filicis]|uniref:ESAT-6-like protein n=1 Tax=Actinorhabdospora filicis TaxID=1785913 RepID=A0A9W6STS4_9ACTN|nr:WXG100 family type VII secretion target [Actinorhabdospora filicis]GLZ81819.1 hypothetical protein Afil01_66260 [Actinorhabdospora filicis]